MQEIYHLGLFLRIAYLWSEYESSGQFNSSIFRRLCKYTIVAKVQENDQINDFFYASA
jgi:hypothetical protein